MKRHQPAPQQNRIEDLVKQLQKEQRLSGLEPELLKFDPASLEGLEKESWHHLFGVAAFQQENYPLAFERFQEGLRQCPESAVLSFALGQEYEFKGDLENMFAYFDRAKFPRISARYALAQARFAYLWNRNSKGLAYVQPLLEVYFRLKILDGTFLHIRGIPFFEETWTYMAAFHFLLGDVAALKALTDRAERACSDFDFERLRLRLSGIETGDYSGLIERLRQDVADATQNGQPVGYLTLQLRVLEAQAGPDPVRAENYLDSVTFTENDFSWLNDIRQLAKCELAHRAGEGARESELLADFFQRQPLLFEPDNAVDFNLLVYQESLKERYQNSVKARR
jgi:tetratricopeptide (TPR) repeat protein